MNSRFTIPDEEIRKRKINILAEEQGDNLRKLVIGESPQRLLEKLSEELLEILTFGEIPLTHPAVLKSLNPQHQTPYFTVAQSYSELLDLYGTTALDLTEEQVVLLARNPKSSARLIKEVLGAPKNVLSKGKLDDMIAEEISRYPNGREYRLSRSGNGSPPTLDGKNRRNSIASCNKVYSGSTTGDN